MHRWRQKGFNSFGLGLGPQVQELRLSFNESQAGLKVPLELYLSTEQQTQSLENLQRSFADPAAGFIIGAAANFSDLGLLGLTMLSAPTMKQAIHIGGTLNSLHCEEQDNEMAYIIAPPYVWSYRAVMGPNRQKVGKASVGGVNYGRRPENIE